MNDPEHQPRPKIKALAGERPCARCGRMFQPSIKRRMLCAPCFGGGDGGGLAA